MYQRFVIFSSRRSLSAQRPEENEVPNEPLQDISIHTEEKHRSDRRPMISTMMVVTDGFPARRPGHLAGFLSAPVG
jgi:hypothetical protein